MVAVSRFVEFSVTEETFSDGYSTDSTAKGDRAFVKGTGLSIGEDSFTVVKDNNDKLYVSINGIGPKTITLASGTDLDARFVARDLEFKLHSADASDDFSFSQVNFRNGGGGTNDLNYFIIYSGQLGNNAAANVVTIGAGANDAQTLLGFDSVSFAAGSDFVSVGSYTGTVTVSGVYGGQFDDFYTIQISDGVTIGDPVAGGGNTYGGTAISDGIFVGTADDVYTVTIDISNGASMDQGSGNVPQFSVADTESDDNNNLIELLHANHFYDVGDDGVRIKFTDAAFGDGDTFTINAFAASGTGTVMGGDTKYIFASEKGDSSKALGIGALATTTVAGPQLGSRGITIGFSNSGATGAGELFHVIARGPQPLNSDVTQLNFGNVTVSTSSAVKVVWFELISGAESMSTVKFSLQSDGTFQHHDQGDADTDFRFGTVGAGSDAPGGGPTSNSQWEFPVDSDSLGNIVTGDIDSDTPPSNLFATKADLAVVSSADLAETIGNFQGGVVSDFIYLAVKLGANETGANSTINYRMFFDFTA